MDNVLRKQFPILNTKINGNNIIYLDNAATTQKPQFILDAISDYYISTMQISIGVRMY